MQHFKIGDQLASYWGDCIVVNIVKDINNDAVESPIIVRFQNGQRRPFTLDGKWNPNDKHPSIWQRYSSSREPALTNPDCIIRKPTWCWVWNNFGYKQKKLIFMFWAGHYLGETEIFEHAIACEPKDVPAFWPNEWE